MDAVLCDFNNGDLGIDWYDAIDISSLKLQDEFLSEKILNVDVFYELYYDHTVEITFLDDNTFEISN